MTTRTPHDAGSDRRALLTAAALSAGLLAVAAAVEVLLTPHAPVRGA
jgi:hypothetical protein